MYNWPISTGKDGIAINVTGASAVTPLTTDLRERMAPDVMIDNPGPNDVYVQAGDASTVATDLSVRVPAGSMQPFRKGQTTHLACKCKAGLTQAIVVHVGEGQ